MMEALPLRILISVTGFAAVVLILVGSAGSGGILSAFLSRRRDRDLRALDDLFLHDVGPGRVWLLIGVGALIGFLLAYALTESWIFSIIVALAVPWLPGPVFARLKQRRLERFEEQLPSVLDQLAASARANPSLIECIKDIALRGHPPARQEFALIYKDMQLAASPRAALETARLRLGSRAFNLVTSALSVSLERGGNLPEALDQISRSLEELWRLEQKLITASAEGRKAMRMITLMPILLFFLVSATQPELVETLVGTPLGWVMLVIAALLYGIGILWARRVLAVNI